MFTHIGRKVKTLAVVLCWIGIVGSVGFAVYAYLMKLLPLKYCIPIGVGGAVVSWIGSWVMYCIGDTNDRLTRAMEEAEPKPGYMDYIQSPATMGTSGVCEFCGNESNYLTNAKIVDKLGTRYRKVCPKCFGRYNCTVAEE